MSFVIGIYSGCVDSLTHCQSYNNTTSFALETLVPFP